MMKYALTAGIAMLAGTTAAMANQTLQIDLNALTISVKDGAGDASAFGGLTHTGSIDFGFDGAVSQINEIAIQVGNGPFVDQGFSGSLVDFTGSIILDSGMVTGGSFYVEIDSGDTYTALIEDGSGMVETANTPGGFTIDGLTWDGKFSDAAFGNVDVFNWFDVQDMGTNLNGSFLHFNFAADDDTGEGYGDVDAFVVVPLPPAALAGAGMLAGIAGFGYIRRRR